MYIPVITGPTSINNSNCNHPTFLQGLEVEREEAQPPHPDTDFHWGPCVVVPIVVPCEEWWE